MNNKYPYELIDGMTGVVVCIYKSLHVACRDGEAKNRKLGERRYYVRRVKDGSRVTLAMPSASRSVPLAS